MMEKSDHSAIPAALNEKATSPEGAAAKPVRASYGERAFNFITYGLWNHGFNLIISAAITFFFKDTPTHKKMLGKLTGSGISESAANTILDTTLLSMGGHITALGVKPLEDKKAELVQSLNAKFSPHEIDAPLADTRKQTWFSVISGRVFTWGAVVLGMAGLGHALGNNASGVTRFDAFQEWFGNKFTSGLKSISGKKYGIGVASLKLGKVLSMELIAVTMGSVLFYASSKLFSESPDATFLVKPKRTSSDRLGAGDARSQEKMVNSGDRLQEAAPKPMIQASGAEHAQAAAQNHEMQRA